jgi:hypothetical protein
MDEAQSRPPEARSAAWLRVTKAKRWLAGGTVALTGIFSAIAAHALPASHAASKPITPAPSAPANEDDAGQQAAPTISPPAQAPQPSSSSSGTVSGGS